MTPVVIRLLKLPQLVISVQTGVHRFNSCNPHKPVVSKISEANIWLDSYDDLTDVGGQREGGCQQLS